MRAAVHVGQRSVGRTDLHELVAVVGRGRLIGGGQIVQFRAFDGQIGHAGYHRCLGIHHAEVHHVGAFVAAVVRSEPPAAHDEEIAVGRAVAELYRLLENNARIVVAVVGGGGCRCI